MNLIVHPSLTEILPLSLFDELNWKVVHWCNTNSTTEIDSQVLSDAFENRSVVVTAEIGFKKILELSVGRTPSVLQVRSADLDDESLSRKILTALSQMKSQLETGSLITLTIQLDGDMIRQLPISLNNVPHSNDEVFSFNRDGFLSEKILKNPNWTPPLLELVKLCINVNRLSIMRLQEIDLKKGGERSVAAAMLFAKATTAFESSCILAAMGMEGEARSQARNCLESGIVGYAVAQDQDMNIVEVLHSAKLRHYQTWRNALKEGIGLKIGDPLDQHIDQEVRDIQGLDPGSVNIEQLAKKAGIIDIYAFLYRYLSANGGHPTWDSLQKVAVRDTDGSLVGISIKPLFEKLGETIAIAIQCQLVTLCGLQIMFPDKDIDEIVTIYKDALLRIAVTPL